MTDSIQILDAGWQMPVKPATQLPYTDGIIYFFEAGTTTPLEVFSDADLSVSLGVSVSCNSSGYPVSSGNSKVLIYTGVDPYKIRITSVDAGATLFEADDVRGALDTSGFLTSAAVARESVVAESSNRAVGLADLGKLINVNCSAGALTMTIDDASDLGDGWYVGIRHDGTANQCKITGNGTDTIGLNGVNVTSFSLTGRGQVVWIVCNGTSFKIDKQVSELIGNTIGVIKIADRLSTPPGSPNPGERYIVTATPTGAWSTFAEHDIAEATGFSTWFKYTPPSDCGWTAFVQDEDANYQFRGSAWVSDIASDTVAGRIELAVQAEMETPTSTLLAVTPARMIYHPAHAKAVAVVNQNVVGQAIKFSSGLTSIADTAAGVTTYTWSVAFASATDYGYTAGVGVDGGDGAATHQRFLGAKTTTTLALKTSLWNAGTFAGAGDATEATVATYGDQ